MAEFWNPTGRARPLPELRVRHEALLLLFSDGGTFVVVATRKSWRQPDPGIAGEGGSSLDKVASVQDYRMGRAR